MLRNASRVPRRALRGDDGDGGVGDGGDGGRFRWRGVPSDSAYDHRSSRGGDAVGHAAATAARTVCMARLMTIAGSRLLILLLFLRALCEASSPSATYSPPPCRRGPAFFPVIVFFFAAAAGRRLLIVIVFAGRGSHPTSIFIVVFLQREGCFFGASLALAPSRLPSAHSRPSPA